MTTIALGYAGAIHVTSEVVTALNISASNCGDVTVSITRGTLAAMVCLSPQKARDAAEILLSAATAAEQELSV